MRARLRLAILQDFNFFIIVFILYFASIFKFIKMILTSKYFILVFITSVIVTWQIDVLKRTKFPKWPTKVFRPAIMAKIADQEASGKVFVTASIAAPRTWASVSPAVTPRARRRTSAVSSAHFQPISHRNTKLYYISR